MFSICVCVCLDFPAEECQQQWSFVDVLQYAESISRGRPLTFRQVCVKYDITPLCHCHTHAALNAWPRVCCSSYVCVVSDWMHCFFKTLSNVIGWTTKASIRQWFQEIFKDWITSSWHCATVIIHSFLWTNGWINAVFHGLYVGFSQKCMFYQVKKGGLFRQRMKSIYSNSIYEYRKAVQCS